MKAGNTDHMPLKFIRYNLEAERYVDRQKRLKDLRKGRTLLILLLCSKPGLKTLLLCWLMWERVWAAEFVLCRPFHTQKRSHAALQSTHLLDYQSRDCEEKEEDCEDWRSHHIALTRDQASFYKEREY